MLSRSCCFVLSLILVAGSTAIGRDRDRDREVKSSPKANRVRVVVDNAFQRGSDGKVIELAVHLIDSFPRDHVRIGYHYRASASIELGRQAANAKQIREGISDARQDIHFAGAEYLWLYIPYLYGLSPLVELEKRADHADMAITVASPLVQCPAEKNFAAFTRRTAAYAALGQIEESTAAYDEIVEAFPMLLGAYNDRGTDRQNFGDLDGAVSDFSRTLQIDTAFAIGYINRGWSILDQNDPQAAEGDFSAALEGRLEQATQALAYRFRGTVRLSQGQLSLAMDDYSAALKLTPQDAETLDVRSFAYFFAKGFSADAADIAKGLKFNPKLTRIVPWQFVAEARAGWGAEARMALDQARQLRSAPTGCISKVSRYLQDQILELELIEETNVPEPKVIDEHLCESHFFIGQNRLLREDIAAADRFREAIVDKFFNLSVYRGARYELGELPSPVAARLFKPLEAKFGSS